MRSFLLRSCNVVALGLVLAAPGAASAQMRGGGGLGAPTPVGMDLGKAPVGAWAEYAVTRGDNPTRKTKLALVGREGGANVVEQSSEMGDRGTMVTRLLLDADPSKEGGVKKIVVQRPGADPMEMPTTGMGPGGGAPGVGAPGGGRGGLRGARFLKLDPKKLVGKETVKVAAGSFKADHYKDTTPNGATVEYWVSADVPPFGLVKLELTPPADAPTDRGPRGPVKMELAAKGKDAKPTITKPAKPFDPEAMRGMWGGRRDGEGGGGPPPGAGGPPGAGKPAAPAAPPKK
jgi:hypothetical protein